jgi:hypothetical protein
MLLEGNTPSTLYITLHRDRLKTLSDPSLILVCKDNALYSWKSTIAKGLNEHPVVNKHVVLSKTASGNFFIQQGTFNLPLHQSIVPETLDTLT